MKKNQNKRNKKSTGKKKNSSMRIAYTPNLTRLGIPDAVRTELTYSDVIAINPASAIGQYTFRGNSIFDPDYTSTGHQPMYRDQLAALYSRYRVYKSTIQVSAVNEQIATALQVTVIPASDITTFTSALYPLEFPYAKGARLLGVGGIMTTVIRHSMSTQLLLGLRPREVLDQDYSALVGANPSSEWYWQIVAQDLSAENVQTSLQVIIRYDVEFYDRVTINPSFHITPGVSPIAKAPASILPPVIRGKQ